MGPISPQAVVPILVNSQMLSSAKQRERKSCRFSPKVETALEGHRVTVKKVHQLASPINPDLFQSFSEELQARREYRIERRLAILLFGKNIKRCSEGELVEIVATRENEDALKQLIHRDALKQQIHRELKNRIREKRMLMIQEQYNHEQKQDVIIFSIITVILAVLGAWYSSN